MEQNAQHKEGEDCAKDLLLIQKAKGNQPWILIGRTENESPVLWPPDVNSRLIRKDTDAGEGWGQEEKGTTEDEMVGWHHRFNGHEFQQTLRGSEGHGRLLCCSPWDCRVRHDWATEQQQKAKGSFEEFLKGSRIKKFGFLNVTVSKVTKWRGGK